MKVEGMLSLQTGKEVWGENEQWIKDDNRANKRGRVLQQIDSQDLGRRNISKSRCVWKGRKYM